MDAFQRYDMTALIAVIREDAVMTMPPFELWIRGNAGHHHLDGAAGPSACAGSILVPVRANGVLAGAVQAGPGTWRAHAVGAAGARGERRRFSRMTFFLDVERLFPLFGLADRIFDDR